MSLTDVLGLSHIVGFGDLPSGQGEKCPACGGPLTTMGIQHEFYCPENWRGAQRCTCGPCPVHGVFTSNQATARMTGERMFPLEPQPTTLNHDTHCTLCGQDYLSNTYRPAEDGTAVLGPSDRPCCPSGCDQGLFGERL